MGRYFEVVYNPTTWNAPAGGQPTVWAQPYGGLHVQAPENLIPPSHSPAIDNMFLRNMELRSRPNFVHLLKGPDGVNPITAVGSFLSPNQVWHTFAFTPRGMFQLKVNSASLSQTGTNPWVFLAGPSQDPLVPVSWASYSGILYFTSGKHLSAWNGVANAPITDVAFLGASATTTVFGGQFLMELDNHIILAYVNETTSGATTPYPTRIRWSNNGFNPTLSGNFGGNLGTAGATFDATINVNAGSNDFLDVPDIITGLMAIGRQGYVFRQNGITEMSATGNGIAPFDFNHMWASQNGVGNVYPFTIAQYGNVGVFVAFEQIYQLAPGAMTPIGGTARDAIMTDLAMSAGIPFASIDRGFQLGASYLHYHLRIPMQDGSCRSYIYSFEDSNWTRWTTSNIWPTGVPNECWI